MRQLIVHFIHFYTNEGKPIVNSTRYSLMRLLMAPSLIPSEILKGITTAGIPVAISKQTISD